MLYTLYEAGYYATTPLRWAARATRDFWSSPLNPAKDSELGRRLFAGSDLFANLTRRYGRPAWNIDSVQIEGESVRVRLANGQVVTGVAQAGGTVEVSF